MALVIFPICILVIRLYRLFWFWFYEVKLCARSDEEAVKYICMYVEMLLGEILRLFAERDPEYRRKGCDVSAKKGVTDRRQEVLK